MFKFQGETEIEIGGRKRPTRICMNQIGEFTAMYGGPFHVFEAFLKHVLGQTVNLLQMRDFLYTALKWGAKKNRLPVDFTNEMVGDWIEEMEQSEFDKFMISLKDCLAKSAEEEKKRQMKATLN